MIGEKYATSQQAQTFYEGRDSHTRGIVLSECPYPPGSNERAEWLAGWQDAVSEEDNSASDVNRRGV